MEGIVMESVWVAVGFAIFVILVWRKVGSALSSMLDARSDKIRTELDEARALREEALPETTILVDCLSVWLGNLFHHDIDIDVAFANLLECVDSARCNLILVASEVGLGIVPETPLGRAYRDRAGKLNQLVAARASHVTLVVAGLPLAIKAP